MAWGFAEVLPDKVTILAETAERPSEIDVERARKSKERAEQRLTSGDTNVDVDRALDCATPRRSHAWKLRPRNSSHRRPIWACTIGPFHFQETVP